MTEALLRLVRAPNPGPMTERGTNTWILGQGQVAVIDPGPDIGQHLEAILAALEPGERVSHILITHPHLDHSALAPRLAARTGAPILAFNPTPADRLAEAGGLHPGFAPDILLSDGGKVEGAGWSLTVLHTPGHLGSHLCFASGDKCFTGDHVMGWSSTIVSPPEGDMGDYMASLAKLALQRWSEFLPGHGSVITDPAARLAELINHRRMREEQVLAALHDGPASAGALVPRLYPDLPPALRTAAERNVLAHLLHLSRRGLVRCDPPPGTSSATVRSDRFLFQRPGGRSSTW
jgi:glyoxylase-like metal-dependent hydrolase (beta-lactamase superfamily II)